MSDPSQHRDRGGRPGRDDDLSSLPLLSRPRSDQSTSQAGTTSMSEVTSSSYGSSVNNPFSPPEAPFSPATSPPTSSVSPPNLSFLRRWTSSSIRSRQTSVDPDAGIRGDLGLCLLHSSPDSLIDLIFVHGLRGGSVKTWRKGTDPRNFWPLHWLPLEKGFERANIHSFGYDSDWGKTSQSALNVHDFGRALFEAMRVSQHLRNNPKSPIVLVGHSMGGLVIKKAFILAQRDSQSTQLSKRIRCIFFLATPHRGSDFAGILKNILKISRVPKNYLADLTTGSVSTQVINEDFVQYADIVSIVSFYETLPMSIANSLIVNKDSAILGYKDERTILMNANHRDICKFDSHDDPNYITLRDQLSATVENLISDALTSQQMEVREQLRTLRAFLGTHGQQDEYYDKVQGSCEWIDHREDFKDWRNAVHFLGDEKGLTPSIYWVSANPGTGKTVLAAHVVSQLQAFNLECAYYYFHFGKETAQTLGVFLRSIAYQMAKSNAAVREALIQAYQDGSTFDHDDALTIWAKLFRGCIFQIESLSPQHWVIDAIDECLKYSQFFTMLKGDLPLFSLRVFITSRKVPELHQLLKPFKSSLIATEIPVNDTMKDIEYYIDSRLDELPTNSVAEKLQLSNNILAKSSACFLWVRLVMDELQAVCTYESIVDVLHGIPEGMVPYYKRTVKMMAENKREKHIAKAVLLWVVTAARPLDTRELSEALELDVQTNFPSISNAIERLCGQLVVIDKQTDLVHIVHATAREFLLSGSAGEFMIPPALANERIALTCLHLLSSRELTPPRRQHLLNNTRLPPPGLINYAVTQFSEHVFGASLESDQLIMELERLLTTNILTWVDLTCQKGDLHGLIRVAKNLSASLDRRANNTSQLKRQAQVKTIESWSVILSRLATKFGKALLSSPSSIYFLIPPLCPTNTPIYQSFGKTSNGIVLTGFKNSEWDDCIATLGFNDEVAAALTCGETSIAVGMESGNIRMFHHRSFQQEKFLSNLYPVDFLHFTASGKYIASCSSKHVMLWDLKGEQVWKTRIRSRCLTLASSSTELVGISEHGRSFRWDLLSGKLLEQHLFPYQSQDSEYDLESAASRAPGFVALSPKMEILALGYRTGAVCLWDFQLKEFLGWTADRKDGVTNHLQFNMNPDINMLLVGYSGSTLALYDSWTGFLIQCYDPEKDTNYASIACSPDGCTLATVDVLGNLRIWDFQSLTPLYQVQTPALSFRILNFTSDGANIIDVTDSQMRIWSPASLVRKEPFEMEPRINSSDASALAIVDGQYESLTGTKITSMCAHSTRPVVFISNSNGDVLAYNTRTGQKSSILYSHPGHTYVKEVATSKTNLLASSDVNCNVQLWRLDLTSQVTTRADRMVFSLRLHSPIRQLIFSASAAFLLISTADSDDVYSTKDGSLIGSLTFGLNERQTWKWCTVENLADRSEQFVMLKDHELQRFSTSRFPLSIESHKMLLKYEIDGGSIETGINSITLHSKTNILILDTRHHAGHVSNSTMFLFSLPDPSSSLSNTEAAEITIRPISFAKRFGHFIGITEDNALFLQLQLWVASIKLQLETLEDHSSYTQHFFVPNEFIRRIDEVLPVRTAQDDIVFCMHGDLAIVKNGLRYQGRKVTNV